jgi:proteasome lid subunit RPN8/RPN11
MMTLPELQYSSVQDLIASAALPPVDKTTKIVMYASSAGMLYQRGLIAHQSRRPEHAFILLFRFATLWIEHLPKHPNFQSLPLVARQNLDKKSVHAIELAEELRPALIALYIEKQKLVAARQSQLRIKLELERQALKSTPVPPLPMVVTKNPGSQLRTLTIDKELMEAFVQLASRNTARNIETCGTLAGIDTPNGLLITDLILSKQTGSATRCEKINDEEEFQYCIDRNLMTLGWVHTHPAHACFLSSVDVHNHLPNQMLMPEAIAIVYAPTAARNWGIFNLTPQGMRALKQCKAEGFHAHPEEDRFTTAQHVQVRRGKPGFHVADLRCVPM